MRWLGGFRITQLHRSNESLQFILDPQLEVCFGNQALKAGFRSSENYYRHNTVGDGFDFKIEAVNLERVSNRSQCRFDLFCHFNLGASMKKFAVGFFLRDYCAVGCSKSFISLARRQSIGAADFFEQLGDVLRAADIADFPLEQIAR